MNKRILLLAFSLFSFLNINAQEYGFGIRGGINTYSIGDIVTVGSNGPQGPAAGLVFEPVKDIGYQFGAYFFAKFGKFNIRPEINYVSSQNHYDFPIRQSNWTVTKIDIPILLIYDIFDPISIYAGPGFGFIGDAKLEGVHDSGFVSGSPGPDLNKTNFSINIGVMLRYKRLGVDLRYELGQGETAEEREDINLSGWGVNLVDLKPYKPNVLSLSVFYDIFRTDAQNIGGLFSGLFKSSKCYCPGD